MATVRDLLDSFTNWVTYQWRPWFLEELKTELVKYSPTAEEEEAMLVRGTVTADLSRAVTKHLMTTSSKTVGTGKEGRFRRTGSTIKELIWSMKLGVGGMVTHLPVTNVGMFSWKRRDGTIHETRPFDGNFLYAVEGVYKDPWYVRPRAGGRVLEPEPNIFCLEMMKTAQEFSMFEKAAKAVWPRGVSAVMNAWEQVSIGIMALGGAV